MNKTIIVTLLLYPLWITKFTTEKQVHPTIAPEQPTAHIVKSDSTPKMPNPEMVLVEGGSYTMGLMRDETARGFGKTTRTHPVTLSSFKIAKYEVTQSEWKSVMGDSSNFSFHEGCAKCPVEEVSWNDVQLFIRNLNVMTGKHYQLPTEAQWEFAARGGNKSKGYKYAGSDIVEEVVHPGGTFTGETHPVGTKHPNELGIYDMSGNVAEWCQDWFDPNYDYTSSVQKDPAGPSSGFGHFIRGGNWGAHPSDCEVTSFKMGYPNDRDAHVGFRLILIP